MVRVWITLRVTRPVPSAVPEIPELLVVVPLHVLVPDQPVVVVVVIVLVVVVVVVAIVLAVVTVLYRTV